MKIQQSLSRFLARRPRDLQAEHRLLQVQTLEPRILYSASPVPEAPPAAEVSHPVTVDMASQNCGSLRHDAVAVSMPSLDLSGAPASPETPDVERESGSEEADDEDGSGIGKLHAELCSDAVAKQREATISTGKSGFAPGHSVDMEFPIFRVVSFLPSSQPF